MKKSAIMFLIIGITLVILSLFYPNIAELCNCDRASLNSEQYILRLWGVMLTLSSVAIQLLKKYISENLRPITTIISFMMSATVSMVIYSFLIRWVIWAFEDARKRPIAYPASVIAFRVSVVIFIILIVAYFIVRRKMLIRRVILIDIAIVFVYFIPFFLTYGSIHSIISDWLAAYYAGMNV